MHGDGLELRSETLTSVTSVTRPTSATRLPKFTFGLPIQDEERFDESRPSVIVWAYVASGRKTPAVNIGSASGPELRHVPDPAQGHRAGTVAQSALTGSDSRD